MDMKSYLYYQLKNYITTLLKNILPDVFLLLFHPKWVIN